MTMFDPRRAQRAQLLAGVMSPFRSPVDTQAALLGAQGDPGQGQPQLGGMEAGGGMAAALGGGDDDEGPSAWLKSGAGAAGGGGDDSGAPDLSGGTGDLSGWHGNFMEMIKKQMAAGDDEPLTAEDKGLALAKAGFGMAASGAHTFGQALGQGAMYGLEGLEKLKAQRAQDRLKKLSLMNSAMGTEALIGQRTANTNKINQVVGLTGASVLKPEEMQPIVDNIIETGDVSALARFGAGPAATANKNLAIKMLSQVNPDLANQALSFNEQMSEHKGYGKGMGERAAGPASYNPSSGVVLNPAAPPGPLIAPARVAPQGAPPAMAPAAAPAAMPVAAPQAAPQAAPLVAPERSPLIPHAIPFSQSMTPAAKAQGDALAAKLGARADEIDTQAASATDANYLLNQMGSENKTWDMGKTTPTLMAGKAYLVGFNNLLPDALKLDDKKMEESVGNYQAFRKNAMELARQTVRATSSRAAFQEMQMIQSALPSADMTRPGFDQIKSQLQGANDYRLAQQEAKDMWMKKNDNNLNGFDPWFNKNFNPAVFLLHRLSPEDREKALQNMNQTASGRTALSKLKDQATYVQKLGLFDTLQ